MEFLHGRTILQVQIQMMQLDGLAVLPLMITGWIWR